jgi:hypothetical protein
MILITTFSLVIFHPGFAFGKSYTIISEQKKGYPTPWKRGSIFTKKENIIPEMKRESSSESV